MRLQPSKQLHGHALKSLALIFLVVLGLIVIGIPGIWREVDHLRRQECVQALLAIESAKASLAIQNDLADGTVITMADLQDAKWGLDRDPTFPPGVTRVDINPIGELPTCVYRDEVIEPMQASGYLDTIVAQEAR